MTLEFKKYILGEWVKHDDDSCRALREYDNTADFVPSPYKHMKEIAEKYGTSVEEMKKHWECIHRENRYL